MVVGGYDLAPASEDCEGTWIDQCRNTQWGTLRLKFTVTEVAVMRKSSTIKVTVFRIDAIAAVCLQMQVTKSAMLKIEITKLSRPI
jgi:hypothetical protein